VRESSVDKDTLIQNLKQHAGGENVDNIPEDMLQFMMDSSQLDIFPILLPTKDTEQIGISIYVDDKGASKKYQANTRLTGLAHTIGYVTQLFLGDGFVGRIQDNEEKDIWRRMDFSMKDFSSDAAWVKTASKQVKTKGADVEAFKKLQNNPAVINTSNGGSNNNNNNNNEGLQRNEYWSFTARDGPSAEEFELTFPGVTEKKKVVVVFKKKTLYVEYDGKEWFGHKSAEIDRERTKAAKTDSGCTIEEIEEGATDENIPTNLLDLAKDPKKTGAELWDSVEVEECTWTIVDKTLQVTLCKATEAKWSGVLKTER